MKPIPILWVDDAATATAWYAARLGFEKEWEHRFEPSLPAVVSIVRGGTSRLFLSEHSGDASSGSLVYLRVGDVGAVASEFGADVLENSWGREVHLTDPDGNRLRVGEPGD